jgi:hypothetical protein
MIILGAGGEPKDKETTIFDREIDLLGKNIKRDSSWNTTLSLNGGHKTTEKIISYYFDKRGVVNTPFTNKRFEEIISQYESKIQSGEIKQGDQLLVHITSHGGMRSSTEISHSIATSGSGVENLDNLSGSSRVSLDRLQSLINLANTKGIKLGILDFSCYSGNALSLQNPNTCIISGTGPMHYGYSNFPERFVEQMQAGRSLEDVFLRAFVKRDETSFPMISTPAGNSIQEELYQLITPYLYTQDIHSDKLQKYLQNQVLENQCHGNDHNLDRIHELLTQVGAQINFMNKRGSLKLKRLREAIDKYHALQEQMKKDLMSIQEQMRKDPASQNISGLQEKFDWCTEIQNSDGTNELICSPDNWTKQDVLTIDFNAEIARLQDRKANATNDLDKKWLTAMITNYEKLKEIREQLLKEPLLAKFKNYFDNFKNSGNNSWNMAVQVSKELQKIYPDLYQERSKQSDAPNPCKDFIL